MPPSSPPPDPATPPAHSAGSAHGDAPGAPRPHASESSPLLPPAPLYTALAGNGHGRSRPGARGVCVFILAGLAVSLVLGALQAGWPRWPWESADFEFDALAAKFCDARPCTLALEEEGYTFAAIGDWGRKGQHHQLALAKAMGEICARRKCRFVVSVGDNFYPKGVSSVEDSDWLASYEQVYDKTKLGVRWYPTLGNHDYMGKPAAQIAYSNQSPRWSFPARYYSSMLTAELASGELVGIALIFLDTNAMNLDVDLLSLDLKLPLAGPGPRAPLCAPPSFSSRPRFLPPLYARFRPILAPSSAPPKFPADGPAPRPSAQDAAAQLAWLEGQLAAAAYADWRVVVGHHPVYSAAAAPLDDGGDLRREEARAVRRHDHTMQHLKPKDGATHYIISGAGSKTAHHFDHDASLFDKIEPDFFGSMNTGFFTLTVRDRTRIQVTAYSRHSGGDDVGIRYVAEVEK
eukprot:tig00020562_g11164.t1